MEEENKNKKEENIQKEEKMEEKPIEEPVKKQEEKMEEKKTEKKPEVKKLKKTEAVVNTRNLPISTKYSKAICKFIKNKKIVNAITDLEQVVKLKKAIPMKGEIPHKKGKRMMAGRFPKNASQNFIKLLKSLLANATNNGLENPIISESIANIGKRPYGKFGSVRKKRTHIRLKAIDIKKVK